MVRSDEALTQFDSSVEGPLVWECDDRVEYDPNDPLKGFTDEELDYVRDHFPEMRMFIHS